MKAKLQMVMLWTKIVLFSVVTIYVALVVLFNFRAVISPGLSLPLIAKWESPNAVVAIFLTGIVSVGIFWLVGAFYRALRDLKKIKTQDRLVKAEKELDDLKNRREPPASLEAPAPIPLEPAPTRSDAKDVPPNL